MRVLGLVFLGFAGLVFLAWGIPLDLLLVGTVFAGLFGGVRWGGATGLIFGAAQDLLGGTYPGLHLLTKTLLGLAAGTAEKHFFRDNPLLPPLALAAATLIQAFLYGLGGVLAGWKRGFCLPVDFWPVVFWHIAVGILVSWFLYYRGRWRQGWKRES